MYLTYFLDLEMKEVENMHINISQKRMNYTHHITINVLPNMNLS